MKTPISTYHKISGWFFTLLITLMFVTSCNDEKVVPKTLCSSSAPDLEKPYGSDPPHYNLNVYLSGTKATSCGYVEFRQETDGAQFVHLDTWVHGLDPNANYSLQRAVDTTIDGNCTGTSWLTLGQGMTPKSIMTDSNGDGYAELYRSVSAIAVGTTFDIHFQIVKADGTDAVLSSDCYQYTVR